MAANDWLLVDLFLLIYNLAWLAFLTYKHYGQVTTKAGHIFELHVQLISTVDILFWILLVELEVLPMGTLTEIINTTIAYILFIAVVCSQIETAIFLKTLNTNTMMTNTAGKIILAMDIFSLGMAVITTLAQPSTMQSKLECYLLTPKAFYQFTIPCVVVLTIVLGVIGYALFRSQPIRKTRENEEHFEFEGAGQGIEIREDGTPSQDGLVNIHDEISDRNRESIENEGTPLRNVEEEIFVEDIEIGFNLENSMTENQQNDTQCLTGTGMKMHILNKYLKNALISLLILTSLLFLNLPTLYAFLTNSECENPTLMAITELNYYVWFCLYSLMPILIKLKLDRLSE